MRSPRHPTQPPPVARLVALRLISRRDYTAAELRTTLSARHYPEEEIDQTVDRLIAERVLDDRRVAATHLRRAATIKGRGRLRIQRELEARGIDRALIRDLLAGLSADDETSAIERFLARKRLPARLGHADRRRLVQQLLRRGFPADAIAAALRRRGAGEYET
jgi:regulatory protein